MTLDLWPAIDLRGGRCVRLLRGDFSAETEYGDPIEQAEALVAAGASRLHVVDLDAAREGVPSNRHLVLRIAAGAGVPVQAGGGIRDERSAAALLDGGVARVVVGTLAVERPEAVAGLAERWPGRVVAGLDHRRVTRADGSVVREVAVRGWVACGGPDLERVLARLEGLPLGGVVVTDIERDGTGGGPDLVGLERALALSELAIIASGGVSRVSDLEDLSRLAAGGRRLAGVIVGRALLSGALSVSEAMAACEP